MRWGPPWRFRRAVTLVIDDGPSDATPLLLDQLERKGHRAVLFLLGGNVAGREEVVVDALRRGFALGNHSFSHPHFSAISLDEARREIEATEALIASAHARAGVRRRGKWFRFPYLDTGEHTFEPLQDLLKELGFQCPGPVRRRQEAEDRGRVDWQTTLNTRDWDYPPEGELRQAVRQARAGDVIEFHDKVLTVGPYVGALLEELTARSLRAVIPGREAGVFW